ncbi:MAG: VCBS repeat-containing protein, partial [Candidatus Methylomirabilis sp.]|nr:VCBS repeat-containing protein [Deltaproteobacteria bacterium]
LLLSWLAPAEADEAKDRFDFFTLRVGGEVRNTLAGDVDGDGLRDLLVAHVVYDDDARAVTKFLSLFRQRPAGFEAKADDLWRLPEDAVAIDLANVAPPEKDLEIVVVRETRIDAFAFSQGKIVREPLPLAANESLFTMPDWSAVRLWDFARDFDGDGVDELLLFAEKGTLIYKRGEDGRYVVSQRLATPVKNKVMTYDEHEWLADRVETFSVRFDRVIPNVVLREWDGDGKPDLVFAWNDRVQVHRGLGGGRFEEAARPLDLRVFSYEHLLRYSRDAAILRTEVEDVSGDGLADVLVSRTAFANLEGQNWLDIFYNKKGEIVRDPHPRVRTDGLTLGPVVADFNADGRNDLLVWYIETGIGALVNYILLGQADIHHSFYLTRADG